MKRHDEMDMIAVSCFVVLVAVALISKIITLEPWMVIVGSGISTKVIFSVAVLRDTEFSRESQSFTNH